MTTRREFLARAGSEALSLGGLTCLSSLGCASVDVARGEPLRILTEHQAGVYDAWCDVLAIGAAKARVSRFVDEHLSRSFHDSLLMAKYVNNPPLAPFYLSGIIGIETESVARFSRSFLDLNEAERTSIVDSAATFSTTAWRDPHPPLFYFVSRSDAVDVVYGTVDGFRTLKIPYLPHIRPPSPW